MKKFNVRIIWHSIKNEIATTPLYYIHHVIFVTAFLLLATRIIGIIPFSILIFIHGIICFIAMKLYRNINHKAAERSKLWISVSLSILFYLFLDRYMLIKEGVPISYLRWW